MVDYNLEQLFKDLLKKKKHDKKISYTSSLLANKNFLAKKIGEEAIEVVLEYLDSNKKNIIKESADLLYHLSVMWISVDVKPNDIWNEFQKRRGKSALEANVGKGTSKMRRHDAKGQFLAFVFGTGCESSVLRHIHTGTHTYTPAHTLTHRQK